ncbi:MULTISPECIES: hypothetical protein [unclassified Pseudoalteromonas]|nr:MULTISPECIES: hypothetical protein [unclassified Pseudoalteromonas]MBR8841292.1 hypothetical protein [Pseudoalteromonas sp. JC3]QUI71126.1 hypothetical protein GSF13_15810 [Pseudoalteromonas sp. M8]WJE07320.1 hypothetical protein QSH61_10405 [Pseudoalteromonas sp. JC3]
MAQFRVETVYDETSNRYFIELYQKDGDLPIVVGKQYISAMNMQWLMR